MRNMNNVTLVCDAEYDIEAHRIKTERLSNSTNVTFACNDVLQIETQKDTTSISIMAYVTLAWDDN